MIYKKISLSRKRIYKIGNPIQFHQTRYILAFPLNVRSRTAYDVLEQCTIVSFIVPLRIIA